MVVVSNLRNNVRSVYDNRTYTANRPTYSAVFTQQDSANADVCSSFCWIRVNTRMWWRDGRPAEHRWRPLFNAAKFGLMLTTWLPCSNAAKTRKPLKLAGVPQTTRSIAAASMPKFTILWGHLEEILLLFFPIVDTCLSCKDIARQIVQWCPDGDFFAFFGSCISSEPRAVHFKPAF